MNDSQQTQIHIRIATVQNEKNTHYTQKQQKIQELRKSLVEIPNIDSSFKVITSIANTMIGSSIIIYPVLFVKDGIIGSMLIMSVIGIALYLTCRLLLIHNRPDEADFNQQIKRILGLKWARFNNYVNFILLYFVCIAYFMLITQNFFAITSTIILAINSNYIVPEQKIDFSTYSLQYATIIAMLFTAPLLCKRQIDILLRFFKFTIYCVLSYALFILASFFRVVAQGTINFENYQPLVSSDFSTVAGAFALSFLIHPVAPPILKRNINPKNNQRDLLLGYGLTAIIYIFVGFVGGLTCADSASDIINRPNAYSTVFDCVKSGETDVSKVFFVLGRIVQFGIFIQNLSVMPILSFLTRKELIQLMNTEKSRKYAFYSYNVSMIFMCLMITIFAIDVSIVLSLNGAIIGFFMAYGIPIYAHLKCYHSKLNNQQIIQRSDLLLSVDESEGSMSIDSQTRSESIKCNDHPPRTLKRHLLAYGGLTGFGVAVGIFKIISLINSFS